MVPNILAKVPIFVFPAFAISLPLTGQTVPIESKEQEGQLGPGHWGQ
jgi:hypothetical protein